MAYGTKKIFREAKDSNGNSIGTEVFTQATVEGRVLRVDASPVKDEFEREYLGMRIESEPGYDRYAQTAIPTLHEQMRAITPGTIVKVVGVQKRNSSGRGYHVRMTALEVVKPGPTGPQLVPPTADGEANSTQTAA